MKKNQFDLGEGRCYLYSEGISAKGKLLNRKRLNKFDLDMYMMEGC